MAPNPLPAPQATLISALAQGVIGGSLNWKMLGIGALVGVGLIVLDLILGAMNKVRIPPLAVGIGIYLPMSATFRPSNPNHHHHHCYYYYYCRCRCRCCCCRRRRRRTHLQTTPPPPPPPHQQ